MKSKRSELATTGGGDSNKLIGTFNQFEVLFSQLLLYKIRAFYIKNIILLYCMCMLFFLVFLPLSYKLTAMKNTRFLNDYQLVLLSIYIKA